MNPQTQETIDRLGQLVEDSPTISISDIWDGEYDQKFIDDIAAARTALVAANATIEIGKPMDPATVNHAYGLVLTLAEPSTEYTAAYLHEKFPNADVAEVVVWDKDGGRHDYTWAEFFERLGIEKVTTL